MPEKTSQWLMFRLSALGDVLLTTGVLAHLHETCGWTFHVLTKPSCAPVFNNNPAVKLVISVQDDMLKMPVMLSMFMQLSKQYTGWGLLDLHGTLRSRLLGSVWSGPVLRYPKYGFARRAFLASGGKLYKDLLGQTTVTQRYALAASPEILPAEKLLPRMYLTNAERTTARTRLHAIFGERAMANTPIIALHPYATHPGKAWPREYWEKLIAMLEAHNMAWIAIGQGKSIFPERKEDLSNSTSLREAAALVAECATLVTGDSGPMHVATAVGTPVLGLFGPTTKEWGFYPSGPKDRVLELDIPCRPCSLHGKNSCSRNKECLTGITPEMVFSTLKNQ